MMYAVRLKQEKEREREGEKDYKSILIFLIFRN